MIIEDKVPVVEVLLATYNREKYLADFLESLSRQQGVSILLRVSDDGSCDSILNLIDLTILQSLMEFGCNTRAYGRT